MWGGGGGNNNASHTISLIIITVFIYLFMQHWGVRIFYAHGKFVYSCEKFNSVIYRIGLNRKS